MASELCFLFLCRLTKRLERVHALRVQRGVEEILHRPGPGLFDHTLAQSWKAQGKVQVEANKDGAGGVMPSLLLPRSPENLAKLAKFTANPTDSIDIVLHFARSNIKAGGTGGTGGAAGTGGSGTGGKTSEGKLGAAATAFPQLLLL